MNVVIIGNGVAGISCARAVRQRDRKARITVISGETDYFFSRTALMYSFMDFMTRKDLEPHERKSYKKQRIDLVRGWVTDLDASKKEVVLDDGRTLAYDKLVLAVGAAPNMFPWKGADAIKEGKVHFVSMQDLDHCERLVPSTREAVVVGGGLIGIELVECLLHHKIKTTFLIREPWYWPMALGQEESEFVAEHMRKHGADVRLSEEMTEIHVDGSGRVRGVTTSAGNELTCQMLGIAAGVRPNTKRIQEFTDKPEMGRGIIVNERFETSLPDVYAIGDCAEIHPEDGKPYGETIWYSAKRHGELLGARILFDDPVSYRPPTFFNSSKFFEVEYTTVGDVMQALEGTPTIYMKLPNKPVSVRVVHKDNQVIGFNMLGSRWNHEVLVRWVEERRSPGWVMDRLKDAQYDVEFGRVPLHRMTKQELPLDKGGM